jgi:hypothetical protein
MGLYVAFQPVNFTAMHVAAFLRALLRHLRGHVILLWDQGSIHQGSAIAEVRRAYPRLHIEEFPAYAPELNPIEQLWNDFKGHTANSLPRDTRGTSAAVCRPTPAESGAHRRNCARSFWLLNCPRHREKLFITYAKFNSH